MVETSSIAALLKRLDAVTTKLEDQAMAGASAADVSSSLTGSGGIVGGPRPSQSLSVPPSGNGGSSGGASLGGSPSISGVSTTSTIPVVDGYDELVNGPLKLFIDLSRAIGGLVEEQVSISHFHHGSLPFD
jgi:adenylyl cyclase-associated protein